MNIKTAKDLASACLDAANNHTTLYVLGCWGAPMNDANKARWQQEQSYNRRPARAAKIAAASDDTFGFDCVCLIKGLLWGWSADKAMEYGGAGYQVNGVPDIDSGSMIAACRELSTDFSKIAVGEAVWMPGHIGIYVGDGLAVEATPIWADGVQVTACNCDKEGFHRRNWIKHGKLPYVRYEEDTAPSCPLLKTGHKSEAVRALQWLLIGRGFSCGPDGADGEFGPNTKKAVLACQRHYGLETDGIAGPMTMGWLLGW